MASDVSTQMVRKILLAAAMQGADANALMMKMGVTPQTLLDPEGRLPFPMVRKLWGEIETATGDRDFGLHLAELSRRMADTTLGLAVMKSPTFGEALDRVNRYSRLIHGGVRTELERAGQAAKMSFLLEDDGPFERHGIECTVAMLTLLGRQSTGEAFGLRSVHFCHPAPERLDEHRRIFGLEPTFGAETDHVIFDARALDHPMPHADPGLCAEFETQLSRLMSRLGGPSFVERVRRSIAEDFRGSLPSIELIADKLKMSPRSLQRRLQQDGSSFQQVLNEVREEMARRYLADTSYPVIEIAFLMGFSELSAFHRAFKRWTGCTPGEFRASSGRGSGGGDAAPLSH